MDPSNAQLSELAEQCAAELLTKDRGFSQGQMPFGDMFMKGFGNEKQNPLGLGGLAAAEANPMIAKWLKEDIMFRNQFDMCK